MAKKRNWKLVSEGKVRRVYEDTEASRILLVAGNAVSAFDSNLGVSIPGKGAMLTKISKYWFERTVAIVPNAYSAVKSEFDELPLDEMEMLGVDDVDNVTPMMKLDMLPIEAIVRGYIAGSAWNAYKDGQREICGIRLQEDLINSSRLMKPIFTPTTKAPKGQHDENLTFDEMVEHFAACGLDDPKVKAGQVKDYSLRLFKFASSQLLAKGIILADTKFEFGINPVTGNVVLADEILTPDSSRFWPIDTYEAGKDQKSLDKQMIRDWVKAHPGEKVTDEVLNDAALIYQEITEIITKD